MFNLIKNFLKIKLSKVNLYIFNKFGFFFKKNVSNKFYVKFFKKNLSLLNKGKLDISKYKNKIYLIFKFKNFFINFLKKTKLLNVKRYC